jgi:hypothetical protein
LGTLSLTRFDCFQSPEVSPEDDVSMRQDILSSLRAELEERETEMEREAGEEEGGDGLPRPEQSCEPSRSDRNATANAETTVAAAAVATAESTAAAGDDSEKETPKFKKTVLSQSQRRNYRKRSHPDNDD